MKSKIVLPMLAVILSISMVTAVDVAYIISSEPDQEFVDAMDDLGLSYEIIFHSDIDHSYDFSGFKILLMGDDYFVNWDRIPVNDMPSLVAGSSNIEDWGWATRITSSSKINGVYADIDTSHEIATGLPSNFKIYTTNPPDTYFLDKMDIFQGFEIIASNPSDNQDAIVSLARGGTTLTHSGYPDTEINANSIFFGMYETEYWGEDTEQLFKNCLSWMYEELTLVERYVDINEGENLISIPLILTSNDVDYILSRNPEIISIKEYDTSSEEIVVSTDVYNNKGYFLKATIGFTLTIKGEVAIEQQTVPLVGGMNLVGLTSSANMNLDDLPEEVIEVARRDIDGSYDIATRYPAGWENEFQIEPKKGYWFKVNSPVDWIYTPI